MNEFGRNPSTFHLAPTSHPSSLICPHKANERERIEIINAGYYGRLSGLLLVFFR